MTVLTSSRFSGWTQTKTCEREYIKNVCEPTLVRREAFAGGLAFGKGNIGLLLALEILANKRVHGRQSDQQRRIVLLVEGQCSQPHLQQRTDAINVSTLAVMLLGSLEEASVVDATISLQLADLLCDCIQLLQHFLGHPLALLVRHFSLFALCATLAIVGVFALPSGESQRLEFLLAFRGAVAQVLVLLVLEVVDLFELVVDELVNKLALVLFGPVVVCVLAIGALVGVAFAQQLLKLIVINVFGFPWRVDSAAESAAKTHGWRRYAAI